MKQKRKPVDWEAIEREYRAGQLSVREIARIHGVAHPTIVQRAKRYGWIQDKSETIRTAIRTKTSAPSTTAGTTEALSRVVDTAVERGVQIVRGHQVLVSRLLAITDHMTTFLERYIAGEDPQPLLFGERESPSACLLRTTEAAERLVKLERQAWNLDEKDRNEPARPAPINVPFELLENHEWVRSLEDKLPPLPVGDSE